MAQSCPSLITNLLPRPPNSPSQFTSKGLSLLSPMSSFPFQIFLNRSPRTRKDQNCRYNWIKSQWVLIRKTSECNKRSLKSGNPPLKNITKSLPSPSACLKRAMRARKTASSNSTRAASWKCWIFPISPKCTEKRQQKRGWKIQADKWSWKRRI